MSNKYRVVCCAKCRPAGQSWICHLIKTKPSGTRHSAGGVAFPRFESYRGTLCDSGQQAVIFECFSCRVCCVRVIQCVDSNDSMISVCGSADSIQSMFCSVVLCAPKVGNITMLFCQCSALWPVFSPRVHLCMWWQLLWVYIFGHCFATRVICTCGGNVCGVHGLLHFQIKSSGLHTRFALCNAVVQVQCWSQQVLFR